ncbi:predicted protein [Postia placenta Mad-698-R]|uniref:Uncharacterized protein n=1 Tax=Postia placenta MAD-698-R-SB12 TaxID=670580 RepID=A0A1X6MLR9_9APHY|nr:hypothetical protein POSPLADRAFT_1156719 [Postia placenta MAD-698-R-SB12]EED82795.1 predicted protein [Postia placenta Mad-698-R]OSX57381.1 hypothetical protein POSPLADRAFT_1156719 [Postia placenta MAD-698-R-SB12]
MMESLPIDTSHPAVRDYLALIRLQVLTPLSLLINIATVIVCAFVLHPSLRDISREYPSTIAPSNSMIAVFITLIYIAQVGYCVLLVLARKPETKASLVKGVGYPLVVANWVMAAWAITWVLQAFFVSTVLLGILLVLLIYANLNLLIYHTCCTPDFYGALKASADGFLGSVTLGWTFSPGEPQHYSPHQWAGFGVVLGVNILGLLVVIVRQDIVWCLSASWLSASLWSRTPKPMPIWLTAVLFTIAHPLALVVSWLWMRFRAHRQGAIQLAPDNEEGVVQGQGRQGGPREVDVDALWG